MIIQNETKANFNIGTIPDDKISTIKENMSDTTSGLINHSFKFALPSRYPIKVAKIVDDKKKGLKVEFYKDNLRALYSRAGTRPILSIAIMGRFQGGKTTTAAGLTGNWGHEEGNGIEEKTDGVFGDGPYEPLYFYERFGLEPSEDIFFLGNENLTPVIFIFDIEGYGGKQHGIKSDVNNKAYVKLCTPFLCLSSAFILIADKNPDIDEIDKIIKSMNISNLTIKSNYEGNGALSLIIGLRNYQLLRKNENKSFEYIEKKIISLQQEKLNDWYGYQEFENKGIKTKYVPMINPINPDGFINTFKFLAHETIRSIEIAAQGNYMRGYEESLMLFEFIINNYDKKSFEDMIKEQITQNHENTFRTIAFRAMEKSICELMPKIDLYFQNNFTEDTNVNDIINLFSPISLQIITEKIGPMRDRYEVAKYINQFELVTVQHIRRLNEKYHHIHDEQLINEKKRENRQLYKEQMDQESMQKLEKQKIISKKLLINQIKLGLLKKFVAEKEKQIEILKRKLQDLPFYQRTYDKKNEVTDEISKNILEELEKSIDDIVDNSFQEIQNDQPEMLDIFNEIINKNIEEIKNKNYAIEIVNSKKNVIINDVCDCYADAKDTHTQVEHLFEMKGHFLKVYKYEKKIFNYPDGTKEETEWVLIKIERKTFDILCSDIGKVINFVVDSIERIFKSISLIKK